ncbi:unnamed protein product, partial [Brassica rapa subsp. trilocularis]
QALNFIGLNVVLDVVYNHLHANGPHDKDSVLDKIVPGYDLRRNNDGFIENSTCVNNTASEHYMVDRLIRDDLLNWVVNYKVDGFRFDLMGHIMKDTMETDGVDGSRIYIYGEGWNFGEVANNGRGVNASQFSLSGNGIGSFNDRIRDATLGGSIWSSSSTRIRYRFIVTYNKIAYTFFHTNNKHHITCYIPHVSVSNLGVEPLKFPYHQNIVYLLRVSYFSFLGQPNGHDHEATQQLMLSTAKYHIQIGMAANLKDYVLTNHEGKNVKGSEILMHDATPFAYASQPTETINYVSVHDNETFFDIISLKTPMEISVDERCRINHLASSMIALSQGIPFFHAGDEILHSKSLDRDSYNSGDWFNRLDFSYKSNNWGVGLPPKGKNKYSWPLIKPRLQDPSFKPQSSHIVATLNSFLDLLCIRYSSPLFRLDSAKEIQDMTSPNYPIAEHSVMMISEEVSAMIKGETPTKRSDPDSTRPERFRDVAEEIQLEMGDDLVHVSDLTKRPEVEMGMEETEETAEKEWSDSGRRGGVESEGQMRKERETRDGERALSVVEEMKRSEEQFVMEIEVTRRSWFLWGEEVGGVEEVRGTKEIVGEGVGEREGAARIVAGKRRGRRSNGGRRGES